MDGSRFDRLTKALAGATRRELLKTAASALVGCALAGASFNRVEAHVLRTAGEICRKNGDCASGTCLPPDKTGRRRCACTNPADCPPPAAGDVCRTTVCTAGTCGFQINTGLACNPGTLCISNATCQADGSCDGTHTVCDDNNACTSNSCDANTGKCVFTPLTCDDGDPCTIDSCDPRTGCIHTPVSCPATDQCHLAGTCSAASGCSNSEAPRGTACSDGNALCSNGACCPSGYQVVHGGCFKTTTPGGSCPGGCGGATGNVDGTANYLCGTYSGSFCSVSTDCPAGQACVTNVHRCITPC